jgi:hypothetical protein
VEQGLDLLAAAPGAGYAHLAWGPAECHFAAGHWRAELDLRPPLAEFWRALGAAGAPLAGDGLGAALAGGGSYPRSGAVCGRLLKVLGELGLASYDRAQRFCAPAGGARTDLARSASQRAYSARLEQAERYLARAAQPDAEPVQAHAG